MLVCIKNITIYLPQFIGYVYKNRIFSTLMEQKPVVLLQKQKQKFISNYTDEINTELNILF